MNPMRLISLAAALVLAVSAAASGGGVLVADGGFGGLLEMKAHVVRVSIVGGVAVIARWRPSTSSRCPRARVLRASA